MFDQKKFQLLGAEFEKKLAIEEQISQYLDTTMKLLEQAALSLASLLPGSAGRKEPLLSVRAADNALYLTAGNRNLIFLSGHGAGVDYRLDNPRGEMCGQVLIFGHLTGQQETELLSNFRVYANGDCLSGACTWNVSGGAEAFKPFLAELIARGILEMVVYLPEVRDLPSFVKSLPLIDEDLGPSPIQHPCVGFECSLGSPRKPS